MKDIIDTIIEYKYELIIISVLIVIILLNQIKSNNKPIKDNIKWNQHYYINLDHRTDRNQKAISEFKKLGITNPNRFSAIKDEHHGGIGCGLSHINVLQNAKRNNWDYVIVMEDDIKFYDPQETIQKINNIFNSDIKWDGLIIGSILDGDKKYNEYINDDCVYVKGTACNTTMYIVKNHYYDTLINLWSESVSNFKNVLRNNKKNMTKKEIDITYHRYAIDQRWKELQKKDKFLMITPIKVYQSGSHSDIWASHYN
tara:strand:+ start:165 stop:932 length:768 start_codon:yes stop_codon:yes gene_type:complete